MTARIFALFIALLTLVNLLGDLLWPGFDGTIWWISFGRGFPAWLSQIVLGISAVALFVFAISRSARPARITGLLAFTLAGVALLNAAGFYWMLASGNLHAGFPVPLSLLVCGGMLLVARAAWRRQRSEKPVVFWRIAAGTVVLLGMFPLAQMLFFGNTDYRRPADAIVVFGSRAYADGRLSDALKDRIRTGCELYKAGLAKQLVLSGGPGDGNITEATAMRNYALSHGVRAEDIFVDDLGLNTEATVRNTAPLFRKWRVRRILAVSHFYHLPRIKLAYQRAGVEVCTVPAHQDRLLLKLPYSMAREVAAFWTYYWKQKPAAVPDAHAQLKVGDEVTSL